MFPGTAAKQQIILPVGSGTCHKQSRRSFWAWLFLTDFQITFLAL